MFYKITNKKENYKGYQYRDGLNILDKEFDDYFLDIENIFDFLDYGVYVGVYVREVTLPIDNPEFKMIRDENKYRANMIILGQRYKLDNAETIKMLIERGAKSDMNNLLKWAVSVRKLEIVKYAVESGADVNMDYAKCECSECSECNKKHAKCTPLSIAMGMMNGEISGYLLEKGASLSFLDGFIVPREPQTDLLASTTTEDDLTKKLIDILKNNKIENN